LSMKALEGATLERLCFTKNQTARAAIIPRAARPPTTPPATAPAWELPPPPFVEGNGTIPVRVDEGPMVDTGGSEAVDSGKPATALDAFGSHMSAVVTLR